MENKKLTKVEEAQLKMKGISTASSEERNEFYQNLQAKLKEFDGKLSKWRPRSFEKKRIKGQVQQAIESLKTTSGHNYLTDKMKFGFIAMWLD